MLVTFKRGYLKPCRKSSCRREMRYSVYGLRDWVFLVTKSVWINLTQTCLDLSIWPKRCRPISVSGKQAPLCSSALSFLGTPSRVEERTQFQSMALQVRILSLQKKECRPTPTGICRKSQLGSIPIRHKGALIWHWPFPSPSSSRNQLSRCVQVDLRLCAHDDTSCPDYDLNERQSTR